MFLKCWHLVIHYFLINIWGRCQDANRSVIFFPQPISFLVLRTYLCSFVCSWEARLMYSFIKQICHRPWQVFSAISETAWRYLVIPCTFFRIYFIKNFVYTIYAYLYEVKSNWNLWFTHAITYTFYTRMILIFHNTLCNKFSIRHVWCISCRLTNTSCDIDTVIIVQSCNLHRLCH